MFLLVTCQRHPLFRCSSTTPSPEEILKLQKKEYNKKYREQNKERRKEYMKLYMQKYRKENQESILRSRSKFAENNRERVLSHVSILLTTDARVSQTIQIAEQGKGR
jgi:hypothetical protein